jgi:Icc-related predicted phosphoesterase
MATIWSISDLHVNVAQFTISVPSDADVLVLAGDVGEGWGQTLRWLEANRADLDLPIILVAGNHELYGHELEEDFAEQLKQMGVDLLRPECPIVVARTRFVGGTLWTDYAVAGDVEASLWWAKQSYPDFWNIDVGRRRLRPRDLLEVHRRELAQIEQLLSVPFGGSTVVVTHHAPHPLSLAQSNVRGPADGSWASDLTAMIETYRPALWIHGHVHESRDYRVGDTRIICNPRGYASLVPTETAGNPSFVPDLVVEV